MSELKSYTIYEGDVGNYTEHVVYSKSEADEVIAHNKYKRCLAMVRWCDEVMMSCELRGFAIHRIWANKHQWAMRWKYKWLENAKQFKEAK